jgi:hypothetical protein
MVSAAGYADSPATTRVSVDSAGNIFTGAWVQASSESEFLSS